MLQAVPLARLSSGVPPSQSNPSVIPGSQANLNGPYLSSVTYPFFTSDHASVDALLAGQGQILDYPPDFSDLQTALSTQYVNVTTEFGSSFENLIFNNFTSHNAGYYLGFRQAIAQLVNYTYAQDTVLNGIQGLVSQNYLLPSAFGPYSTNDITTYTFDLAAATASLGTDPQIAFAPAAHPANVGTEYACTAGQTGVWQYATSSGSHVANGTDFNPKFYTRPDHATWYTETLQITKAASLIGLCLDRKDVIHFSNIYPIVYKAYSDKWDIYFGGASYASPLDPVSTLFFGFGTDGFVTPFDNTGHYQNSAMQALLDDMHSTSNVTQAEADSRQVVQMISSQLPVLMMWWDAWAIPSLNNHGATYWSGYVDTPGFGSWTFAVGYYTLLNLHRVNPTTGEPLIGGNAVVNLHEAPDDFNLFFATSVYDFDVLNSIYFDTPVVPPPGSPYVGNMIPWMLTSAPAVTSPVTMTTPHGYHLVDGQVIHMNLMNNITFHDNVKVTANDLNFSMWYFNYNGAYGPYVNNTGNYVGLVPALTDSKVINSTALDVYVNSTAASDYKYIVLTVPLPEHLWSHVGTDAFNGDIDPTNSANNVNGASLLTGTAGFYWSSFVTGQYVKLDRFPGYFRTNIHAWQLPLVQAGNAEPVSFAITQAGTPIPASASATATAWLNHQKVASAALSLNSGNWTGSFSTTGWAAGFYEVVANATYTDSFGQAHTALQFYGLTVTSPPPPGTSNVVVTVTSSTGTPISGATVTIGSQTQTTGSDGKATFTNLSPGTLTVTITASGYQSKSGTVTAVAGQTETLTLALTNTSTTTSTSTTTTTTTTTTTPSPDYTWYYVGGAVVIVALLVGVAAYSRRKK